MREIKRAVFGINYRRVCHILNIQPRDAWSLTVSDFWMLWDAYLNKVQIQTGNNYKTNDNEWFNKTKLVIWIVTWQQLMI